MSVVSPRNGPTPSEEDNSLLWWIFGAIASKPESQNQPEIIKKTRRNLKLCCLRYYKPLCTVQSVPCPFFQKIPPNFFTPCLKCEELPQSLHCYLLQQKPQSAVSCANIPCSRHFKSTPLTQPRYFNYCANLKLLPVVAKTNPSDQSM